MLPLLTASNILRTDDNGNIMYNNRGMESTLADISFEPDENESITVDELLELDNDILCSSAETDEHCYSNSLSDPAVSSTFMSNGRELNVDDDDDPSHCNFFAKAHANTPIVITNTG